MSGLPTTPGSVVYWLGSFAHLRDDGCWVDDNGDACAAARLAAYSHPELFVVWDAKDWRLRSCGRCGHHRTAHGHSGPQCGFIARAGSPICACLGFVP